MPSFRSRIRLTFAGQIGFAAIALAASIVTARLLEPAGRGELAILILLPTLLVTVLELGQEFTSSALAARSPERRGRLRANAAVWSSLLVVPAVGLTATLFWIVPPVSTLSIALAAAAGLAVGTGVYLRAASGLALGSGRVGLYNLSRTVMPVSFLAGVLVAVALGHTDPRSFFYAWCASSLFVAFLLAVALRSPNSTPCRATAREQLRTGLPVLAANVSQFLLLRADQLVLAVVAGGAAVGHYVVAVNVVEALWYLPAAAGLISLPFLSGEHPEGDKAAALVHALRISFWSSAAGGLVLVLAAPAVVPLVFGDAFSAAVRPLQILVPGAVAAALVQVSSAALIAKGEERRRMRLTFGALALNLVLTGALVPSLGAVGAAIASTVSYAALGVLLLRASAAAWSIGPLSFLRPPPRLLTATE